MRLDTKLLLMEMANRFLRTVLLVSAIAAGIFVGLGLLFWKFKLYGRY